MQQPGPARAGLAPQEGRRRRSRAAEALRKIQGHKLVPEEALVVALAQGGSQGLVGHGAHPSTRRPAGLLGIERVPQRRLIDHARSPGGDDRLNIGFVAKLD